MNGVQRPVSGMSLAEVRAVMAGMRRHRCDNWNCGLHTHRGFRRLSLPSGGLRTPTVEDVFWRLEELEDLIRGIAHGIPDLEKRIHERGKQLSDLSVLEERLQAVEGARQKKIVQKLIQGTGIETRLISSLVRAGYETAEAIQEAADEELMAVKMFGKKGLKAVREVYPYTGGG